MSAINISHVIGLVIFYGITGFGPGFIIGLLIGNIFAVRDERNLMQKQYSSISAASQHNRQWHPSHKRWQNKG